jgi:hypothetical protein
VEWWLATWLHLLLQYLGFTRRAVKQWRAGRMAVAANMLFFQNGCEEIQLQDIHKIQGTGHGQ